MKIKLRNLGIVSAITMKITQTPKNYKYVLAKKVQFLQKGTFTCSQVAQWFSFLWLHLKDKRA